MKAKFVKMEWENRLRTIASFYFAPLGVYRYEAGQFASLVIPHDDYDSRGYSRTMTLSSSPTEKLLKFTMRLLPVGGSSFKQALANLQPGDEITVFESMGDLILPLDASIPLVFVAGGVGIASFTGMTQYLLDTHEQRSLTLHYTVARPGDICLQQPFDDYADWHTLPRTIYTPADQRLSADNVLRQAAPDSLFYISGTEKMVEAIVHRLLELGLTRARIVFDYFDGYSEL